MTYAFTLIFSCAAALAADARGQCLAAKRTRQALQLLEFKLKLAKLEISNRNVGSGLFMLKQKPAEIAAP